jgi:ABC-type nitrate/sulfonate/bicarbonate transport system permease component
LVVWVSIKYAFRISDRFLPGPIQVITGFRDIQPSILIQSGATLLRLIQGGVAGTILGLAIAIFVYDRSAISRLLLPSVQAFRSIPAIATVPFFLLWFGFEEIGKFLLVCLGVGLNIFVAAYQILEEIPERYQIVMKSFGRSLRAFPISVLLPLVVERVLPTLRSSLSIAFGVVVVAELLGAQVGLGYLIQTSRTTYSIHVIFLATFILGFLNTVLDRLLIAFWTRLTYWNRQLSLRSSL